MKARDQLRRTVTAGLIGATDAQDKIVTQVMKVPLVRVMEYEGVLGVWVPLHPLAEIQRTKPKSKKR